MCYSALIKADLDYVKRRLGVHWIRESFDDYEAKVKSNPKKYKSIAEHPRIYPNYYAPVIVWEDGRRVGKPMRYRLRPSWAEKEIPTKYNLFNARLDALEERKSWKALFMRRHGLFAFEKFFEWVEDSETGKKKVISFAPQDRELMWAPCLWDRWTDGEEVIESFAIITTDPPPEVAMMGHDRCPVFLREDLIDTWLQPEKISKKRIYEALHTLEPVYYGWADAA